MLNLFTQTKTIKNNRKRINGFEARLPLQKIQGVTENRDPFVFCSGHMTCTNREAHRRIAHVQRTLSAVDERLNKEITFWQDRWLRL